jgi:GT2 family glycosyltransferase
LATKDLDQVVVLDDASADDKLIELQDKYLWAEFVFGDKNLGPGGNRNRIIGKTKADLIWFLDSDMQIKTDDPRTKIEEIFNNEMNQVVGTLILNDHGDPMGWNYGHFLHAKNDDKFFQLTLEHKNQAAKDNLKALGWDYAWIDWLNEKPKHRRVDWTAEGSFIVPTQLFEAVGGYDEEFAYHEGQDLAWRLKEAGTKIYFDPAIVVSHLATRSRRNEIDQAEEAAAKMRFYRNNYGEEEKWV